MTSMRRPPIEPIEPAFTFTYHSAEQLDRLKQATLDILETVGVRFESAKALDLLAEAGAGVDRASQVAKLPPALVLEAMATAPRRFVLGARDASCDISVGDGRTYCTTDGCGVEIIDFRTRERRRSTKADLADVSRLQDALSSIAFWWPTVSAGDHGETAQLHELDAGWNNTVKHLQGMVNGEREARYAVEMATVIAGSAEELRRRPVMSDLIGTISPLVVDKDAIEAALVFAAAGVPVTWVTMPTLGTTAPATKAGAYALGSAELVAATVVLQLASPGAPVVHSTMQSWADPRSGNFVSFPLDGRTRALGTELAHHWGVPAESAACGTDSPVPGTWQAGVEEALDLVQAAQEGSDLLPSDRSRQRLHAVLPGAPRPRGRHLPPGAVRGHGHRPGRRVGGAGRDRRGRARRALPRQPAHAPAHARRGGPGAHASAGAGRGGSGPRRGGARAGRGALARVSPGASGGGQGGRAGEDPRGGGRRAARLACARRAAAVRPDA